MSLSEPASPVLEGLEILLALGKSSLSPLDVLDKARDSLKKGQSQRDPSQGQVEEKRTESLSWSCLLQRDSLSSNSRLRELASFVFSSSSFLNFVLRSSQSSVSRRLRETSAFLFSSRSAASCDSSLTCVFLSSRSFWAAS